MARHNENDKPPQNDDLERVRSTPLRPVVWMTSVLVWATVVALIVRVPAWASIFLCTITGISFLLFLIAYIYLFTSDRDALRAERWRRQRKVAAWSGTPEPQRSLEHEHQRYIETGRPEFAVKQADEREVPVRVGNAGQGETK